MQGRLRPPAAPAGFRHRKPLLIAIAVLGVMAGTFLGFRWTRQDDRGPLRLQGKFQVGSGNAEVEKTESGAQVELDGIRVTYPSGELPRSVEQQRGRRASTSPAPQTPTQGNY